MRKTYILVFVFVLVNFTQTQYLTIGSNRKHTSKSVCDTSAKSALVEHFFNIIFTEFHNTAPICVCVQMCPDQPTYCYPNGCLRREGKTKKVEVPVQKISENTNPIFFIDENNDFMNDFLTKNYIDDNTPLVAPAPPHVDNPVTTIMRPDPFKDRYKILFNYKKLPKVELKYNLAEQVKNMKSEVLKTDNNVDVSNTRWPLNKFDRRLNVGQKRNHHHQVQMGPINQNNQQSNSNSKYYVTMFPGKDGNYPPKYFKRELPNDTNSDVDIKAIYVVGKSETENNIFSLEKIIDSLIESSFDKNASTPDPGAETVVSDTIVQIQKRNDEAKDNTTKPLMKNETTKIISMNLTNENVDKNKYSDDLIHNTSNFSQMIATLSKRIDRQNNTSLEIMKDRIGAGDFEDESVSSTSEKPVETTLHVESEHTTAEHATESTVSESRTTRKIRKRIIRRLQNGKIN